MCSWSNHKWQAWRIDADSGPLSHVSISIDHVCLCVLQLAVASFQNLTLFFVGGLSISVFKRFILRGASLYFPVNSLLHTLQKMLRIFPDIVQNIHFFKHSFRIRSCSIHSCSPCLCYFLPLSFVNLHTTKCKSPLYILAMNLSVLI